MVDQALYRRSPGRWARAYLDQGLKQNNMAERAGQRSNPDLWEGVEKILREMGAVEKLGQMLQGDISYWGERNSRGIARR